MAQDNQKPLFTLYETLKSDNYDVPDTYESFERTLTASGKEGTTNRMTLYNSLKSDNYDVPDTYESFANTLFVPATTQQQTPPTTTATPSSAPVPVEEPEQEPVLSAPEEPAQPAWQPTEQEMIHKSHQMYSMLNDFNQKSKARLEQIQRLSEPFTPEGRENRKAMKFQAQVAGAPTKVMGFTPPILGSDAEEEQGGAGGAKAQQPAQSDQSPVPYGVKYVDGKPVTQWLLPDGRVTTDLTEADQAEYVTRTARLRYQFENRMKENGLDPAKPEDVKRQAEYDSEDEYMKLQSRISEEVIPLATPVVEGLWREAEEKHKADKESNANKHWDSYAGMGGGHEMRIVTTSMNRHDDNISRMTRFDIEKMMDNAWNRVGSQITDNCYNRLRQQYPGASEEELRATASEMARSLSDNAVYQYAVQQNTPKSTLEHFGRTVADMNVINSISKGLARSQAGTSGDLAAYEAAMGEYGKNHRVAQVTGTVFGMAADPVTLISGGFGSLAGKSALYLSGRFLASRAAGMTTQMGSRLFGSSLTGRIIVGSAGAAGNLATYEGLKEAESQWLHGGHVNAETGEVEEYSAGEILKSTRHGMLMGSVIGPFSPVIGNIADKAVLATTSTIGKVGVRSGEIAVSTLAEGTIFATHDLVGLRTMSDKDFDKRYADKYGYANERNPVKRDEARRNARSSECWDVWDDSMAMMLGFKAQRGIKSAPRVIASLRPIKPTNGRPLTQAERNHNRMSFEERVRKALDPANPNNLTRADDERVAQAMRFTADEREELRRAGYGELVDLFSSDRVQDVQRHDRKPAEGAIELRAERVETETGRIKYGPETVEEAPIYETNGNQIGVERKVSRAIDGFEVSDGYSAMEELMQDSRVSQAARAKAYYILTGRILPMGTVTGYTTTTTADGRVTINATTANGEIVTSRTFKNDVRAKQEVDNIMRQAELNSVDVGERFKEAVADDMVLDAAISEVSPGADPATIKKIYRAVKAGNKDVTESQVQLAEFLDDAIARNKDIADKYRPEAIREVLKEETGIDVDAVLRKMPSKRTEAEQAVVKSYLERLFPEEARQQAAEPTPEQAEAQSQYEQGRLLYGRFEEGDPTVQADIDAIALRMQEAYQAVEDVFGAEAEYYMFHVNENPWALVNDPELTFDQQDAVLYYINAKAALDGVMDASNEAADRKRAEVEESVAKRTHKDNGVIIPATMKVDDRPVYIVKGDVVMFPDGSAVDVRNSSESVIVMDAQTGEYEFTSPDQIFQISETVNPQDELDTALSVIEQEQMSIFGENAVAPEEHAEGAEPQPATEAPATADTEAYDRGYEQGLEKAAKADDAWIANHINILSQNTPESMPDTMKGELDAYLYEQQRRAQSVPETPENVLSPTENAVSEGEIVPEAVSNVENGQQPADDGFIPIDPAIKPDENGNIDIPAPEAQREPTPLQRIPVNEQGEPVFEAVDPETAWDGLVEAVGGDADAADIAMAQVQQATTDLEALKKKQPTLTASKLKGSPMAMVQAKREAAEQYQRDLAQYNQQIADTQARLDAWNNIVGVYNSRNAERSEPIAEGDTELEPLGKDPNDFHEDTTEEAINVLANIEQMQSEPTEAQKAAGNYKMEHRRVDGYNISIENAKGSVRRGTGADGKPWETTMQNDYGYIRGTEGVDGDHIDVFLSDTPEEGDVFVVDQVNEDGSFDEHKVMYGFPSEQAAREAYLSNYESGWVGLGAITHVSKEEFKKWIGSSKRKTKPFADYKTIKETRYDNMGNPIDSEGNHVIEDVKSLNDISDSDFTAPSRSVGLPTLPQNVGEAIGTDGRKVIIKKNIFIKNRDTHPELSPTDGRDILHRALYNPNLVGTTQPIRRPDYKVAIQTGDKNAVVVLDVYAGKDNVEIVGWRKVDETGLEKMKRQAEREGGQFLILSPREGSAAALSALPSNVSSDGKVNTLSADKQADSVESSEPYTITPAVYVGKSRGHKPGKETPMHRVMFNRPLTEEQERAVKAFAKEAIGENKGRFATKRGWADREAADGSWLFRTEEDARKAGEMIVNEEAIADAQPLSREDIKQAAKPADKPARNRPAPMPANTATIEDIAEKQEEMPVASTEQPAPKGQFKVTDEMKAQEDELRKLLGIDDDEGSTDSYFRDPDELTPEQKRKVFSLGVNYAFNFLDNGVTTFPDFAKAVVGRLGSKVKPFIKSWYEGAKRVPGYGGEGYTDSADVDRFDIENFDKPSPDAIRDAAMRVAERKAKEAAEQAEKELIAERNEQRKKDEQQTAADTAALAEKAEIVADKAENIVQTSADPGELSRASELIDQTLDEVNDQLAILGYYEAEQIDKDFNEAYGYMRNAEKKAVKDAVNFAKQLVSDLGLEVDKVAGSTTAKRGKKPTAVSANIAPAGGDISIRLPLNEGRELYIAISLDPSVTPGDVTYSGDNLQATRIMYRIEWPDEKGLVSFDRMGRNCWADANVSYADLLNGIQREAKEYLPKSSSEKLLQKLVNLTERGESPYTISPEVETQLAEQHKAEETHNGYKVGDDVMWDHYGNGKWEKVQIEDFDSDGSPIFESVKGVMSEKGDWSRVKPANGIFGEAKRVARAEQEKKKKKATADAVAAMTGNRSNKSHKNSVPLKPEQHIGNLFSGLFDNLQNSNNHERTDLGTRPGEARGQRQQLKQDTQVGGDEPRRETERPAGETGSGSTVMDSDADRAGSRGLHDVATQPALERLPEKERKNVHNNHVERGTEVAPKSENARIKANIAAIETMKKLVASGDTPSAADMKKLRAFSGWGGLGKAFSDWDTSRQLRQLLGDKLYDEGAEMSRNSAYFTPAYIVDAMWDIARAMGFKGGRVLEGSAGIGNVLGLMPEDLSERSHIRAVEKDPTTGKMLSLLYPDAVVDIDGFEKVKIETGTYDLVITNVPFVPGLKVADTSGDADISKEFKTSIHDFCIAKNVRKLRDGGVGVFITTAGSMDGTGRLYKWLSNRENADIVGMFRMHNETFGGTNATSDIIVVRKRVNGIKSPHAIDCSLTTGVRTAEYDTGEKKKVKNVGEVPIIKTLSMSYNRYYVEHPEYMAGEMHFGFEKGDTSFRPESKGLYPIKEKDQSQMLSQWVEDMKQKLATTSEDTAPTVMNHRDEYVPTHDHVGNEIKTGTIVVDSQGRICVNYDGTARPLMSKLDNKSPKSADERIVQFNKNKVKGRTRAQVVQDYNAIKKALNDLLEYQNTSESDEGLQPKLQELNRAFDSFVATYGHLHGNNGLAWLKNDVDYPSVIALETYREEGLEHKKVFGKADIFSRRVIVRDEQPKATNVRDGVTLSIRQTGALDTHYIAKQLGMSEADVRREVIEAGLGYENPLTHSMEAAHEYLSGNVREKMQQAEANNDDGRYTPNITALRKVVPHSIPSHFIEFSIGSSWLRPELFEQYIKERTGASVKLTYAGGMWAMDKPRWTGEQDKSFGIRSEICDKVITGTELIESAMTNRTIRVSKQQKDGPTISDPKATSACAAKVDEIRDDFKSWMRSRMESDPELAKEIEDTYNNIFNNSAPMTIPDEYIPEYFDGAARIIGGKHIKMREHQAKAVVRGTMQSLMLAHEVGTGKTFTLITTAMEMRRLGTAKKPMIVVQNATLGQFVASAKALYPDARILSLEDRDRNAEGRKDFYAKIRYNDWDMVVIPQSVLERIPDHPDRERRFIEESIQEKMDVIEAMSKDREAGRAVATLKKEVENLRDQLNNLSNSETAESEEPERMMITPGTKPKKDGKRAAITKENAKTRAEEMLNRATDDTLNFDDLGVDAILVDEAHEYKHLGFATAMQRGVKGVDPSYSKKCQGLYLKVKAVQEKSGGRNVIFATGTPISNTAAEVWTFMRYLLPREVMEGHNIWHFDDFVRNFGSIQQMLEFTTQGTYKENNRFAGYSNLPELARIWAGTTDTVLTAEAGEVKSQIPELEGGQPTDLYLPQTNGLRAVLKFVRAQLKAYDEMSGQEKKENRHIPLVMYGIAKAAAIDARLVMANAPDDPHSKTNESVRQTLRSLEDSKAYNGTVAIFADNYQRKNKETGAVEFNLFDDIRTKLIAQGVPAEQVVIMRDGMTDKAKEKIFAKVNAGEIRVILGTTQRLGVGVNIQERLHTLMHIDAPNRPMDYWQRMGRLLRQGNLHKEMGIPVRVIRFGVEDSLDVTAYQRLKTKGAIADAIMHSKDLLANNLENRILEEEGDEFGNITAELSGSQYAMLQNQTEKELRKLQAKQDQHRQHQMYIYRAEPRLREAIDRNGRNIVRSDKILALLESNPTTITINGKTYQSRDDMQKVFEAHNKAMAVKKQSVQQNKPISSTLTFDIGNVHFTLETNVSQIAGYGGQGGLAFDTDVRHSLTSDDIDFERSFGDIPLKRIINELVDNVTNGKEERSNREAWVNAKERAETDLAALLKDKGKPFEHSERIKELEQKLEEYTTAMQEELKEKEAKYAKMDADIEDVTDITFTSEDDEDSAATPTTGDSKFRDGERMSDGERLRAIRALAPVVIERNTLNRSELFAEYRTLPDVTKDGVNIQFLRTAFGKNYKEGGLFAQVVPHLDDLLLSSVLAYSEEDSLGGTRRPDGTEHKVHPNVMSFDNYVNKVKIGDSEYYVRMTVQKTIDNTTGLHSCFVSNVDVYKKTVTGGTDSAILRRPNTFYDGIVDAKLQQFFERASSEALELDKADRVKELSEKLNTPVRIVTEQSDIDNLPSARHRRAKGYFDPATGEVVIVVPNNRDVADVDNTFVHEVVGHKGLRALIGEERFDKFLREVYDHARPSVRKKIDYMATQMARKEGDRLSRDRGFLESCRKEGESEIVPGTPLAKALGHAEAERRRKAGEYNNEATEEYMSDLGGRIGSEGFEKMSRDELTLWGKIKAKVQAFLDKFLQGLKISRNIRLSDKDLSYILFKSWKNMRDKQGKGGVFADAEDAVMRWRTGFGESKLRSMTRAEQEAARAEATADRIEELFDKAVSGDLTGKPVEVGRLTADGKAYLERLSGIKLKENVRFMLNPSDLIHIHKEHFGENEKDPGNNIPLNADDIRAIAKVISTPDKVLFGIENRGDKRKMFFFLKESDGNSSLNLLEVYSNAWGNLTAKSFFKSKKSASQRAMSLITESPHLTSVTDGPALNDGTKLPKFFEYPKTESENGMRFRDPSLGLEETITKMKVEALQANTDNLQAKRDAMRAIGGNLNHLRQAMARQRDYDITTVKSVADLARVLMDANLLDDLSKYETKRILGAINNVVGKQDVSQYVQKVMDIMVDNQLRNTEAVFGNLISMRTSRADGRGINVQGALDPDGQMIIKAFKSAMSLPAESYDSKGDLQPGCIASMINDAMDRMSDSYAPIAERAALEYAGLQIAREYAENVANSKQSEKILREEVKKAKDEKDAGRMTADAYRQFEVATRATIQQMKLDRIAAYESLMEKLGGELRESVERAKAWREAEKGRVNSIHHLANSDMQGRELRGDREDTRLMKLRNSWLVSWLLEPMSSLDQMLKMMGSKNPNGEGYLQNHFMRGWIDSADKEQEMKEAVHKQMDDKASEIFGKRRTWHNAGMLKVDYTYSDLYDYAKAQPGATIEYYDGAEMREYEKGQGELLYLYAVEKMPMGRATNRRMGIDDTTMQRITNALDPKLKEYADWVQDELLPQMGDSANEVHKRMFGANMDAIENYFPFVRDKDALNREVENGQTTKTNNRISVQTGAIKKRVASVAKWNMRQCNFMDVLAKHVDEMCHWTAFAELNRDFGTLLSYNRLKQQVFRMNSAYGAGEQLWKRFQECCAIATDAYEPRRAKFDRVMVQGAKGVAMDKISWRNYTALKQILSLPAFFGEVNLKYVAADLGTGGVTACKWAWKNMPNFRKRILSRTAGDYRLKENEYDGKIMGKIMKVSSNGMLLNIGVDAWTIAVGSHGVYKTRKAKYLRWGMDESQAERRAVQDAELCYNKSQQSSEGPFMAPVQVDHTFFATSAMLFRTSSTSYTREAYTSARNLKRLISGEVNEEYVAKQILRTLHPEAEEAWTDEQWEKARENAKKEIRSAYVKNAVNLAMFGWILPWLWRIGSMAPLLLLSNDDDEKRKQLTDALKQSAFAPIEGLAYGDVIADGLNILVGLSDKEITRLGRNNPMISDVLQSFKHLDKDWVSGVNDVLNIVGGMCTGMNPQTFTDWVVAIMDASDDRDTQKETALLVARLLNCPQSQLDIIYFDELDLTGTELSQLTPADVAERYAEYKMHREAPLTGWMRSDEAEDSIRTKHKDKVLRVAKERINNNVASEHIKQLLTEYDAVAKRQTEINELRKTDRAAFVVGRKELFKSVDMRVHGRVKRYKRDMEQLTDLYLKSGTQEERDSIVGLMFSTRDRLLEELDYTQQ